METLLLHTRDFNDGVFAALQRHLRGVGADYFRLQIRQENRAVLLALFDRLDVRKLGFLSAKKVGQMLHFYRQCFLLGSVGGLKVEEEEEREEMEEIEEEEGEGEEDEEEEYFSDRSEMSVDRFSPEEDEVMEEQVEKEQEEEVEETEEEAIARAKAEEEEERRRKRRMKIRKRNLGVVASRVSSPFDWLMKNESFPFADEEFEQFLEGMLPPKPESPPPTSAQAEQEEEEEERVASGDAGSAREGEWLWCKRA